MPQKFAFGFTDALLTEVGQVSLRDLHFDVDAIIHAHEAVQPIADRLGVPGPRPHIAGFTYPHIASLGANIEFPEHSDPAPSPLISSPEEIDALAEPDDYLAAPLIRQRLGALERLIERCPHAAKSIGHPYEGPITTAALILGQQFFTLPYDDPERAHRLLDFSSTSALNYARAIHDYFGAEFPPNHVAIPDDFAGIFPPRKFREFVLPYWERFFAEGREGCTRFLHSELLRPDHLPLLAEVKLDVYDPGVNQYLDAESVSRCCPCRFQFRISPAQMRDLAADDLVALYRRLSGYQPVVIAFSMNSLAEEEKARRVLEVARKLAA